MAQTISGKCLQIGICTSDLVPDRTNKVGSGGYAARRAVGVRPICDPILETQGGLGIDISQEFPKPLADEVVQAADVVILVPPDDSAAER
jgi:protein-tyrosine-phosphatase